MVTNTLEEIDRRLRIALDPVVITLGDDSAKHAGHAGAASGGGHYRAHLVSPRFAGLTRVARHRLVYDPLSDLMRHAIHALAIEALTPAEAEAAEHQALAASPTAADASR
jgi:BolA protein